jgi:hypothetical protein
VPEHARQPDAAAPQRQPAPSRSAETAEAATILAPRLARVAAPPPLTPAQVLHLQRTVGNRAVGRLLAQRAAGPAGGVPAGLVQRTAEWKDDNHPDDYLDAFVTALNTVVQTAATTALEADSLPDTDGYLTLWKDTAVILRAIADDDLDKDDSDVMDEARAARSFGAARYGYAVESLACGESGTLNAALPARCVYQLQATRGMTRPDIVVRHETRGEIAWLDITSAGSKGHIDRKTGNGWKAKPYVAEITYPVLDPTTIGVSTLGIGERVARRNAIKRRVKAWEDLVWSTYKSFKRGWDARDGDDQNKANQQAAARASVAELLGVDEVTPQVTKSLIRVWKLSVKDYGFDSGGTKAEGEEILRSNFGA